MGVDKVLRKNYYKITKEELVAYRAPIDAEACREIISMIKLWGIEKQVMSHINFMKAFRNEDELTFSELEDKLDEICKVQSLLERDFKQYSPFLQTLARATRASIYLTDIGANRSEKRIDERSVKFPKEVEDRAKIINKIENEKWVRRYKGKRNAPETTIK